MDRNQKPDTGNDFGVWIIFGVLTAVIYSVVRSNFHTDELFIFVFIVSCAISIGLLWLWVWLADKTGTIWVGTILEGLFLIWFISLSGTPISNEKYTGPCSEVAPEDRSECFDEYFNQPQYDPADRYNYTPEPDDIYGDCDENGCPWDNESVEPATDCNIKGNITFAGEKIYHMPGQNYYNETIIDPAYGERWFCTEAEARANGWRKAYQ